MSGQTISISNGTLSVTQAALIAKADNKTRTYGAGNPALTISYIGLVNGDGTNAITTPPTAAKITRMLKTA